MLGAGACHNNQAQYRLIYLAAYIEIGRTAPDTLQEYLTRHAVFAVTVCMNQQRSILLSIALKLISEFQCYVSEERLARMNEHDGPSILKN